MGITILIIDDNEGDCRLIEENFKDAGLRCRFSSARSGEEGIENITNLNPDVVILDTQLPGLNGFEVCKKIKNRPEFKSPVIMMTGVVDAVDAAQARESGADDYTVKTQNSGLLIEAVRALVPSIKFV